MLQIDDTSTSTQTTTAPPAPKLPPFSARRLRMQLMVDILLRLVVLLLIAAALVSMVLLEESGVLAAVILVAMIVAAWLWLGTVNARVLQQLDNLLVLIEQDQAQAESMLVNLMQQRGLMRWVRLLLYQRLALLRHRQQKFDEAVAVVRAVLGRHMGPAESVRASLLLLLVEADLKTGQMHEAYHGLCALAMRPLPLIEQVQRMALQTQYEVMLGYSHAALHDVWRKVSLAELMPPAQCGAWHAQMAKAAQHARQQRLAQWLNERARLLSQPPPNS
ncbi:MAG: hypothetical protein IT445_04310 [Phycisphaeraceae bacterium]|nr:hypothetical protein [Phycisphaeraceae bacterium]